MHLAPEALAQNFLRFLADRPNPVLFAGAGVGHRVGFPTWGTYLEGLAEHCAQYGDATSAALIRERVAKRNWLGAASVFKTCESFPVGERWKALAAPFRAELDDVTLDRLTPLVGLGFTAIVTTNWDRSLHDADARHRRRSAIPLERGKLHGSSLSKELFIARIHGSAEEPELMVVDAGDYERLRADEDHLDFLVDILRNRSCLFVGFSFLDPAIAHVLAIYEAKFGPTYEAFHAAAIPSGQADLSDRLKALNIEPWEYDPADEHADLWRAIRIAFDARTAATRGDTAVPVRARGGFAALHHFIAFAYAQLRSKPSSQPLLSAAQDGLVASIVASKPDEPVQVRFVVGEVMRSLGLTEAQATELVEGSLARLQVRDQVLRDGSAFVWRGPTEAVLEGHLLRLAESVTAGMRVREGVRTKESDLVAAKEAIETVLMSRAWDVAAHFAGAACGWTSDVQAVLARVVSEVSKENPVSGPGSMERAILALLTSPDGEEADLLTTVGRAAFGAQLLLSTPRQVLYHRFALPHRAYLDANVLMPAITQGHPLRPIYADVLTRLTEAAARAGLRFHVGVGMQFLNEVVSHRRLALDMVEAAGLEDPDRLGRHIQFHGAVNTNVFVGAYASFVGRRKNKVPFREFLASVAPYDSEEALSGHLASLNIESYRMDYRQENNPEFVRYLNPLQEVYEQSGDAILRGREAVLVRHEAQQLTKLHLDSEAGLRSLFVTADSRLRRALLMHPTLRTVSGMTVSHLGLVAIADIMVGLEPDSRAFSRLIWTVPFSDHERSLFEYFVNVGLRNYEEGLAMEMQQTARYVAIEAAAAAKAEGLQFGSEQPEDVAKTADFLDRFEDRFFVNWREVIERREQESQ